MLSFKLNSLNRSVLKPVFRVTSALFITEIMYLRYTDEYLKSLKHLKLQWFNVFLTFLYKTRIRKHRIIMGKRRQVLTLIENEITNSKLILFDRYITSRFCPHWNPERKPNRGTLQKVFWFNQTSSVLRPSDKRRKEQISFEDLRIVGCKSLTLINYIWEPNRSFVTKIIACLKYFKLRSPSRLRDTKISTRFENYHPSSKPFDRRKKPSVSAVDTGKC